MTLNNSLRFAVFFLLVFACAGIAAAQGPVINTNTTTSELEMTATVQTAVQLNISTGSGGATVSGSNSTGLFTVSFGNINGLGLGTPTAGVTVVTDSSGALYKTPINLTPVYSGFASTAAATISVQQKIGSNSNMAREGDSSISASSTVSTTTPATVATAVPSGVAVERQVGLYAAKTEAAGAKSATLVYRVTVQ